MSMELPAEKIRELRAEVERLQASGVVLPPTLAALLAEVESAQPHERALHEGLGVELRKFEVSHPRITAIANDILMTLSSLGI